MKRCVKLDELDRAMQFAWRNDEVALTRYINSHSCRALKEGTRGIKKDHSVLGSATCIRPRGETECLWLPDVMVQKAQ
jgi:hypothetical protein